MDNPIAQPLVLLADDEPLVRDLLQGCLEDAGYEVVAVSSGAEAIEALDAQREFIAVVTDINFGTPPAGWEVAVRARELRSDIAVVYMTGDSAHEWSAHGVTQSTIITKPFAPSQIAVAVATLLNTSCFLGWLGRSPVRPLRGFWYVPLPPISDLRLVCSRATAGTCASGIKATLRLRPLADLRSGHP